MGLIFRFQNVNSYRSVLFQIVFCSSFGVTSGLQQTYLFASAMSNAAYHSECCTGGESMATLCVNPTLALKNQPRARGLAEHGAACIVIEVFVMTRPGIEPTLPALVVRARPTLIWN